MKRASFFIFLFWLVLFPPLLQAAEKVRVGTPVRVQALYNLPILAAQDKGIWRGLGLDLEYLPFRSGTELNQAVAAGALDMGITGALAVVQAVARGLPEIIVADLQGDNPFYLWVPTASHIRDAKDLKGARIGVNRLGGTVHAFGLALARALRMEKDIKFVAGGGVREEVAAIKAGTLEGRMSDSFALAPLKYSGEMRELISMRDYLPRPWPDLTVLATLGLVGQKPEVVRKAVKALLQGAEGVLKDEAWALAKMKEEFGYSEGLAKMVFAQLRYGRDGKIDPRGLENIRNFLVEYRIIPKEKAPPVEKLFTREFTG